MKKIDLEQVTLNEGLKLLGYETQPSKVSRKTIAKGGKVIGCFSAKDAWAYLRKMYPQHFKTKK